MILFISFSETMASPGSLTSYLKDLVFLQNRPDLFRVYVSIPREEGDVVDLDKLAVQKQAQEVQEIWQNVY